MCADPMGMRWMIDLMARKPKPSNTEPGLIYMFYGALQHSYTDPFDRTSPPIPIGPHWMIIWPFDAKARGPADGHARCRNPGDVCRHALRASARLWFTMGRQ